MNLWKGKRLLTFAFFALLIAVGALLFENSQHMEPVRRLKRQIASPVKMSVRALPAKKSPKKSRETLQRIPARPELSFKVVGIEEAAPRLIFSTNLPAGEWLDVKVKGQKGRILKWASFQKSFRVQVKNGPGNTFLKLQKNSVPTGALSISAFWGEVKSFKKVFNGQKGADFERKLARFHKKLSFRKQWEQKFLRSWVSLMLKVAKQPGSQSMIKKWRAAPHKELLKFRQANANNYVFPEAWQAVLDARGEVKSQLENGPRGRQTASFRRALSSHVLNKINRLKKLTSELSTYR